MIHYRSDDFLSDTHDCLRSIIVKFTGAMAPHEVQEYDIIDVRPDSLLLQFTGDTAPEAFQRLPE